MKKYRIIFIIVVAVSLIVVFSMWLLLGEDKQETVYSAHTDSPKVVFAVPSPSPAEIKTIKVYITGAVLNPGVYEIESGLRIEDAVRISGGATDDADLDNINLALKIRDEQQIKIPFKGDPPQNSMTTTQSNYLPEYEKININSAKKEELMMLDGIGETIAAAIIEYRESYGGFKNIEDLKNVTRIGDKIFETLKDKITVD